MLELSDVIKQADPAPSIRRARVISVSGRNLKVDLGGEGGITIPSLDSCNPLPDQWVYIIGEGSSMTAIGAAAGQYRQAILTATGSSSTAVNGLLNGRASTVTKAGLFDVSVGDQLPLMWAADGSHVWVLGKAGAAYVPPADGGGGSTGGGGGTITTGTATYAATGAATFLVPISRWSAPYVMQRSSMKGAYFYGYGRFRELQGRTITGFRINATRAEGSGTLHFYTHGNGSQPGGDISLSNGPVGRSGSGWVSLPTSMANWLIGGSGTGGIAIHGDPAVTLAGIPYGTLQFDWRK